MMDETLKLLRDRLIEAIFIARGAHEKVHLTRDDLAVLLDAHLAAPPTAEKGETPDLDDPVYGLDSAFNACSFKPQCQALRTRLREAEKDCDQHRQAAHEADQRTMVAVRSEKAELKRAQAAERRTPASVMEEVIEIDEDGVVHDPVAEAAQRAKASVVEAVIEAARELESYLAKVNTPERQSIVFQVPEDDKEGLAVAGLCERLTKLSNAIRSIDRTRFGGEGK